jgi:hypothetical protein
MLSLTKLCINSINKKELNLKELFQKLPQEVFQQLFELDEVEKNLKWKRMYISCLHIEHYYGNFNNCIKYYIFNACSDKKRARTRIQFSKQDIFTPQVIFYFCNFFKGGEFCKHHVGLVNTYENGEFYVQQDIGNLNESADKNCYCCGSEYTTDKINKLDVKKIINKINHKKYILQLIQSENLNKLQHHINKIKYMTISTSIDELFPLIRVKVWYVLINIKIENEIKNIYVFKFGEEEPQAICYPYHPKYFPSTEELKNLFEESSKELLINIHKNYYIYPKQYIIKIFKKNNEITRIKQVYDVFFKEYADDDDENGEEIESEKHYDISSNFKDYLFVPESDF